MRLGRAFIAYLVLSRLFHTEQDGGVTCATKRGERIWIEQEEKT